MRLRVWLLAHVAAALVVPPMCAGRALADETCRFAWPLDTELGWFRAAKVDGIPNGSELPEIPEEAFELSLLPRPNAKLPVSPSKTREGDGPNAGSVAFANVPAGTYQVTIESDGWVDAVQDGAALKAFEHTGSRTCAMARKSVRFKAQAGKLVVEIAGATGASIKVAVKRVE